MSYEHTEDSIERLDEATRLLTQLQDFHEELKPKELSFVTDLQIRIEKYKANSFVSLKQLTWLRDIAKRF